MLGNMSLSEPIEENDWIQYFDLRWRILRAPWQQARGSERDDYDSTTPAALVSHVMAQNSKGKVIGVGRIHRLDSSVAQIRYMAVDKEYRRLGIASQILQHLESSAVEWHCYRICLNARQNIHSFYTRYDYKLAGDSELLFNKVPHVRLLKELSAPVL